MKKVMTDTFSKLMLNILVKTDEIHNDLPFLPERIKIEKFEKLVTGLHDKTTCVIQMRNIKQPLNHG